MRTGILGGTFDPPHIAHLVIASEALYQIQLDRVLWVPTPYPPHKQGWDITPVHIRVELVQAAIQGEPRFQLSRVDIDRPPPQYALDTIGLLHGQNPLDELVYLIGADSLRDLPTWHLPVELVQACDGIGVMRRPSAEFDLTRLEAQLPGLRERLRFVDAPLLEVSSRDIRLRASRGRPYRFLVPEGVWELIQENNLYEHTRAVGDAPRGSVYK
jgi:nicotinate-nucleotide adenylyltransferase